MTPYRRAGGWVVYIVRFGCWRCSIGFLLARLRSCPRCITTRIFFTSSFYSVVFLLICCIVCVFTTGRQYYCNNIIFISLFLCRFPGPYYMVYRRDRWDRNALHRPKTFFQREKTTGDIRERIIRFTYIIIGVSRPPWPARQIIKF